MQIIPTTLVYPLIEGFENCFELRHSIRSFSQFLHIDRVIVVGDKPEWFTGEHIPMPQYHMKEEDIYRKVCEAAGHIDRFIFANDDHFMLRPDMIEYYYSRPLFAKCSPDFYGTMCKNTYELFGDGMFFDIHTPMIIESDKIPTCYPWSDNRQYVFKSLYCNHNKVDGKQMADCKIPGFETYDRLTEYCIDRPFLSLGAMAFSKVAMSWLSDRFPEKSKFEN